LPQQAERARSSWRRGIGTIDRKPSRGSPRRSRVRERRGRDDPAGRTQGRDLNARPFRQSMIPKSVQRFSEKIMLKQEAKAG
jgi:hypothetical protein